MKPIAILHEDNGHKELLSELIDYLNSVEKLQLQLSLVDFYSVGRKSHFFKSDLMAYKLLKGRIVGGSVKKVLFVIDADSLEDTKYGGVQNTKHELKKIAAKLDIQDITQIYVVSNPNSEEGHLESMLLATLPIDKRNCLECFVKCSKIKSKSFYKTIIYNLHKTAYPLESFYNFTDSHFNDLKTELKNLFQDI